RCALPTPPLFPYTTLFRSLDAGNQRRSGEFRQRFGIPQANVRVICQYMGGGFGSKALSVGAEGLLCAKLAKLQMRRSSSCWIARDRKSTRLNSSHRTISYA